MKISVTRSTRSPFGYKVGILYRTNCEEFRNSKPVISQQPEMGEPPNFAHILPRGLPAPHKILKFF